VVALEKKKVFVGHDVSEI